MLDNHLYFFIFHQDENYIKLTKDIGLSGMNGIKEKRFVSVGEASRLTGLEAQTVRKMADKASILSYKTPSGQRRIDLQSIQAFCATVVHDKEESTSQRKNFIYARVSTKKQVDDLSRQLSFIQRPEYTSYTTLTDIASGINFKRKGLSTILEACLQGCIGEVVVAHRDRLCRFGFELVEQLVTKAGGKITVLDDTNDKTCEQELTDDLLSIIHVFSCRQMGKRSYANRKTKNIEDKDLSDNATETDT
jgi:predicted site-specific integrase-resolvase